MAYAINVKQSFPEHSTSPVFPGVQVNGKNAGSGLIDLGAAAYWQVFGKIKLKTFAALATQTVSFTVEIADDTAFATNLQMIAVTGALTEVGQLIFEGWGESASGRYVRITAMTNGATTQVYDAEVYGKPVF